MLRSALCAVTASLLLAPIALAEPKQVVASNFVRAETDRYFADMVARGTLGELLHERELVAVEDQLVIRMNRDTLYSSGVFDLAAGPVTVTMPETEDDRYAAVQVISQDHLTPFVIHDGTREITREDVGTRYMALLVRVFVDPNDPADLEAAHAVQDAIGIEQASRGSLELPEWDMASLDRARAEVLDLAALGEGEGRRMGTADEIDPVEHFVATAAGWGLNPETEATYVVEFPEQADGETVHRMTLADVPVDGFWSVTVYNAAGFLEPNDRGVYSVNNVTAARGPDGAVTIQFGGCDKADAAENCLPITEGWNYLIRLYRPQEAILTGAWTPPKAQPVE